MSKENELKEVATALAYQRTVGADSRITELEQELQELKETLAQTIENDEVAYETLKLHDQEKIEMLNSKVAELKQQIEKMKCCSNCNNEGDYKEPYRYGTGWCNICKRHKVAKGNFDKWEIKENVQD